MTLSIINFYKTSSIHRSKQIHLCQQLLYSPIIIIYRIQNFLREMSEDDVLTGRALLLSLEYRKPARSTCATGGPFFENREHEFALNFITGNIT